MDFEKIVAGWYCEYCQCETKLVLGEIVYPHKLLEVPRPDYLDKKFYVCQKDINHYVGTYRDNVTSLGRVADSELRRLKNKGHRTFDPLWRELKIFQSQQKAYDWLSNKMDVPPKYTHFGMFTNEQCLKAIALCEEILANPKAARKY
jgi:hypothetical protein